MSTENDSALVTLRGLLLNKLLHHQHNPSNFYRYSESFRGAASLAQEVAATHDDAQLLKIAGDVLLWIDTRADALEQQSDAENRRYFERMDAARAASKAIGTAVKGFVGMVYEDERWEALIGTYSSAFPTFIIRQAVHDRLHPRKRSTSVRKHLGDLIAERKLGRAPSTAELESLFPEAYTTYIRETLTYLERALPGYDFYAEWNNRYGVQQ